MAKKIIDLKRTYTHAGKDYGPGPTEVPEELEIGGTKYTPYADLLKREEEYRNHIAVGGEPVAPVTPSLTGNVSGKADNATALNTPAVTGPVSVAPVTPVTLPSFGGKPLSYFTGKSDDEILKDKSVDVGPATLKKIREAEKAAAV